MGALLLALGLAGLRSADTARSSGDTTPARRPDGVGTAPASGSAASSSSTAPSLPEGAADGDPSATAPTPGRCDAPICTQVSTSGMVSHAGQRFAVGDPGDEVTVGDWDCDGSATVLVLRPRTGEVFAFAAWAGPAHDVPAAATTVAGPGSHLVPAPIDADGCSAPLVRTDDGRTSILALPEPGATP